MHAATRATPTAEPNITPMIDVLLVLLIVFMVAVVQVHHSMDVQLPKPTVDVTDAGTTSIVLEVRPGPSYRINGTPAAPAELYGRLVAIYSQRPEKVLYIAGAPTVRYDDVIQAMDVARSAGVRVLGVVPKTDRR